MPLPRIPTPEELFGKEDRFRSLVHSILEGLKDKGHVFILIDEKDHETPVMVARIFNTPESGWRMDPYYGETPKDPNTNRNKTRWHTSEKHRFLIQPRYNIVEIE